MNVLRMNLRSPGSKNKGAGAILRRRGPGILDFLPAIFSPAHADEVRTMSVCRAPGYAIRPGGSPANPLVPVPTYPVHTDTPGLRLPGLVRRSSMRLPLHLAGRTTTDRHAWHLSADAHTLHPRRWFSCSPLRVPLPLSRPSFAYSCRDTSLAPLSSKTDRAPAGIGSSCSCRVASSLAEVDATSPLLRSQ